MARNVWLPDLLLSSCFILQTFLIIKNVDKTEKNYDSIIRVQDVDCSNTNFA